MENSKIKNSKNYNSICGTKIYPGDNNELICIKTYKGDWGDWDEKPENNCSQDQKEVSENSSSEEVLL